MSTLIPACVSETVREGCHAGRRSVPRLYARQLCSRTILAASLPFAGAALRAAQAAPDTWAAAIASVGLPNDAKPGDERYGYTCVRQFSPQWPSVQGWWRVLKQGTTPHWYDANHDGKKDPEEIKTVRYCVSYILPGIWTELGRLDEAPGADGIHPAVRRAFEGQKDARPVPGIGQTAIFVPPNSSNNGYECRVGDGPAILGVNIRVRFDTERGSSSWILSTEPNQLKAVIDEFPEREALVAMVKAAHAGAEAESLRVAGEVAAAWRRWTDKKIADGSGPKGLYQTSPAWLPQPRDVPTGLAMEGSSSSPQFVRKSSESRREGDKSWTAEIEERYEIRIASARRYDRAEDSVDAPLQGASADYEREIRNAQQNFASAAAGSNAFRGPQPFALAGADVAMRFTKAPTNVGGAGPYSYYNAFDTVVFRLANVVVVVAANYKGKGVAAPEAGAVATPQTEALAALVLKKIRESGGNSDVGESAFLSLTATPRELWADGKEQSTLRLIARTADGRPISAAFTIEAEGGGKLSAAQVTTGADGTAEVIYTASTRPGEATVTALGRKGIAVAKLGEGGVVLQPKAGNIFGVLADGRSALTLVALCTDPGGRPLADVPVRFNVDEKALPANGRLEPATARTDATGRAEVTYSAPAIGIDKGFRLGEVAVTAAAATAGRELGDAARFLVYAGEVAFVEVAKPGYAAARFPVQIPGRNALVKGALATRGFGTDVPRVAFASIRAVDAAGHASPPTLTGEDGTFTVQLVGDPTSPAEGTIELPTPLLVSLDPDLANRLTEGRAALRHLAATGHDVSEAAGYLARFPAQLARSKPGHADPVQSTEYAVNVLPRVAWMCLYAKLAADRQDESIAWFLDSIDPAIKQLADLLGVIDTLEQAAKEKLGDQFNATAWKNLKETVAGRFLRQVNVWHRRQTRPLRKAYQVADKVKEATASDDLDAEKGATGQVRDTLQLLAEPTDAAKEKLQEATGTDDLGKKFRQYLKAAMTAQLRANMDAPLRANRQALLAAGAKRATQGLAPGTPPVAAADRAKQLFTDFEKEHHALNVANLDRELYRLDANLFMNTVVKGVFVYQSLARLASAEGLAELRRVSKEQIDNFQKSVSEPASAVDAAAATLDSAFGAYKGLAWLDDLAKSSALVEQLDAILLPTS